VGESPAWLRRRLLAIGLRPINNVVDVTNYVLWETGQPLHAFDLATLRGARVVVRAAAAGERLRTLDGEDRQLAPGMLVIADAARPIGLAGVMGGEDTEVTAKSTDVLIESAWFDPLAVRRNARKLGMHTDASHRFERGVDPEGQLRAALRAARRGRRRRAGSRLRGAAGAFPEGAAAAGSSPAGWMSAPQLGDLEGARPSASTAARGPAARWLVGVPPGAGRRGTSEALRRAAFTASAAGPALLAIAGLAPRGSGSPSAAGCARRRLHRRHADAAAAPWTRARPFDVRLRGRRAPVGRGSPASPAPTSAAAACCRAGEPARVRRRRGALTAAPRSARQRSPRPHHPGESELCARGGGAAVRSPGNAGSNSTSPTPPGAVEAASPPSSAAAGSAPAAVRGKLSGRAPGASGTPTGWLGFLALARNSGSGPVARHVIFVDGGDAVTVAQPWRIDPSASRPQF
jgi:hypothetical protein